MDIKQCSKVPFERTFERVSPLIVFTSYFSKWKLERRDNFLVIFWRTLEEFKQREFKSVTSEGGLCPPHVKFSSLWMLIILSLLHRVNKCPTASRNQKLFQSSGEVRTCLNALLKPFSIQYSMLDGSCHPIILHNSVENIVEQERICFSLQTGNTGLSDLDD